MTEIDILLVILIFIIIFLYYKANTSYFGSGPDIFDPSIDEFSTDSLEPVYSVMK